MQSKNKPVVVCGITGGIAVYKTVDVASRLHKAGMSVHVLLSRAARRFVAPLSFQAVTGRPVATRFFCRPDAAEKTEIYPHLYPASEADLFVVMPATADALARLAAGHADDLVCASALALPPACIKVLCPAMNTNMWNQPVVQENLARLEARGWRRIGPESGALACGASGEGRMAEPEVIAQTLRDWMHPPADLTGKKVLVLSGPTREYIDEVRFVGNSSSGRMGRALAEEAAARGAEVRFVSGPVAAEQLPRHERISIYHVTSAENMLQTARRLFDWAHYAVFAAAVADYAPAEALPGKRPKDAKGWTLKLEPTPDIAATLGKLKKPGQITTGFALQEAGEEARARAKAKLEAKHFDLIILNDTRAMGADQAAFECLRAGQDDFETWGTLTKADCAAKIFTALSASGD